MEAARRLPLGSFLFNLKLTTSILIILSIMTSNIALAQSTDEHLKNFLGDERFRQDSLDAKYDEFDFSDVWTTTENSKIVGIIGEEHRRIKVKILTVEKSSSGDTQYEVIGKSSVMGNICDFTGAIKIKEIYLISDNNKPGIESGNITSNLRGVLVANYEFLENTQQDHVGIFYGRVYSKWYLDSLNRIVYDTSAFNSTGYINNAFIGYWKSYEGNDKRICNWGDYRVPLTNDDFDVGNNTFMPADKYRSKDWDNYIKAWRKDDAKAKIDELLPWWK